MIALDQLEPPTDTAVIKVSPSEPIWGQLREGDKTIWVVITAVLERTAIFERPGRDILHDGRELAQRAQVLVEADAISWKLASHAKMPGGRMRARRCLGCKRFGGASPFRNPDASYCIDCEKKRG